MQDCASTNKIKENKYKILRMSLLLGSDEDQVETLNNFEDASREIDIMNDEIYLKDIENKFYDTTTLEEEEKKLAVLVDYIGGRVEQRISLLSDFANVTGFDLTNLPAIKYYDKLDDYKDRLKYIREYLENTEQIKTLNQEIEAAEKKLKEAYLNKATSEEYNQRNEDILLNKFENIIKTSNDLKKIDDNNIDSKLNEIIGQVEESKKSLDIFNKSFATLSGSGISYEEEAEYKSYVDNAKALYYSNKEQEYLLRIYQYLLRKEVDYSSIVIKRETINSILYERMDLRRDLNISEPDILSNIYELLERQYDDIKRQKDTIENIETLTEAIDIKKEQVNDLEIDNQKVEILSLLREYGLIDTYTEESNNVDSITEIEVETEEANELELEENSSMDTWNSTDISSTTSEESIPTLEKDVNLSIDIFNQSNDEGAKEQSDTLEESPKENQVIAVENPTNIDLDLIHAKANKVMQRVGEMLGIKTKDTKIVSVENTKEEPIVNEVASVEQSSLESSSTISENPLFNNDLNNNEPVEEVSNFWFESETPDALNELPDLSVSNDNFFANNNIPDLNFPDLKLNFGPNEEEK